MKIDIDGNLLTIIGVGVFGYLMGKHPKITNEVLQTLERGLRQKEEEKVKEEKAKKEDEQSRPAG